MKLPEYLLEKLVCPKSKQPLELIEDERISKINQLIREGQLKTVSGEPAEAAIEALLCCQASSLCYQVVEGIPNMISEDALPISVLDLN